MSTENQTLENFVQRGVNAQKAVDQITQQRDRRVGLTAIDSGDKQRMVYTTVLFCDDGVTIQLEGYPDIRFRWSEVSAWMTWLAVNMETR